MAWMLGSVALLDVLILTVVALDWADHRPARQLTTAETSSVMRFLAVCSALTCLPQTFAVTVTVACAVLGFGALGGLVNYQNSFHGNAVLGLSLGFALFESSVLALVVAMGTGSASDLFVMLATKSRSARRRARATLTWPARSWSASMAGAAPSTAAVATTTLNANPTATPDTFAVNGGFLVVAPGATAADTTSAAPRSGSESVGWHGTPLRPSSQLQNGAGTTETTSSASSESGMLDTANRILQSTSTSGAPRGSSFAGTRRRQQQQRRTRLREVSNAANAAGEDGNDDGELYARLLGDSDDDEGGLEDERTRSSSTSSTTNEDDGPTDAAAAAAAAATGGGGDKRGGSKGDKDTSEEDATKTLERALAFDGPDPRRGQGATMYRVLQLAYPERYILVVATIALVLSSAATVVLPLLIGRLHETIATKQDLVELNRMTQLLVATVCMAAVFSLLRGAMFALASERLVARLRVRLYRQILRQDVTFFDTSDVGELLSRLVNDAGIVQTVTSNASLLVWFSTQTVASLALAAVVSWKLALLVTIVVPPLVVGGVGYSAFIRRVSTRYQSSLARAADNAEEAIRNIRVVKACGREADELRSFATDIATAFEMGRQRGVAMGLMMGGMALASFSITFVVWYGGRMVIRGDDGLTASKLTTFLLYALNLGNSVGGLADTLSTVANVQGAAARVFSILDSEPEIEGELSASSAGGGQAGTPVVGVVDEEAPRSGAAATSAQGGGGTRGADVTFENVCFRYPSRPEVEVLRNVSFTCAKHTLTVFAGPSGSGKSSIMNLVMRFYDPTSGLVRIDGVSLRDVPLRELRRRIALVPQDPVVFTMSVADNIAFGAGRVRAPPVAQSGGGEVDPSVPATTTATTTPGAHVSPRLRSVQGPARVRVGRRAVEEAARKANAFEFCADLPRGFDTVITAHASLSGGQRQRLAIARAVLADPDVLILDEPTSALDSASEQQVQSALEDLMRERTSLMVAHRLSSTLVRRANRIVVLENGRVAQSGTHEELVSDVGGLYAAFVQKQHAPPSSSR